MSRKFTALTEKWLWKPRRTATVPLPGSLRSLPLERTFEKIKPLFKPIGIKIVRIDQNDEIGLPVYWGYDPVKYYRYPQQDWNFGGKGRTPLAARVSICMESLERTYASRLYHPELVRAAYRDVAANAEHPERFAIPGAFDEKKTQEWGWALSLMTFKPRLLHANFLLTPFKAVLGQTLFEAEYNGLASGNTAEEAVLHGLYELIERDCSLLVQHHRIPLRPIDALTVDDRWCRRVLGKFRERGTELLLLDLSVDMPGHTLGILAFDSAYRERPVSTLVCGTHHDPAIALTRCLTELCQERANYIFVERKYAGASSAARNRSLMRMFLRDNGLELAPAVSFATLARPRVPSIHGQLLDVLGRLKERGVEVFAANLSSWQDRISIVKLNAVGLQPLTSGGRFFPAETGNLSRFSKRWTARMEFSPRKGPKIL